MFKKILLIVILSLSFSITAFADDGYANNTNFPINPGPYLGAQFGIATLHYDSNYGLKTANTTVYDNKVAGRIYAGYEFTEHLGLQLGYTYYSRPEFRDNATGLKENFAQYAFDLSGVAWLPFAYNFGGFLKAGLALVYRGALTGNQYFVQRNSNSKLAPLLGAGFTYNFNPNWSTDLGWSRIFSNGDLPKSDFYAVGLRYRFSP